jgi:hypothetical protein
MQQHFFTSTGAGDDLSPAPFFAAASSVLPSCSGRAGGGQAGWHSRYHYVLFEDPDGIRLEVNFVPGAGLLADGAQFDPGTGYA